MSPSANRRGVIGRALLGLGALIAGASAGAVSALQATTDLAPRVPSSIWPTSVGGWAALLLSAAAVWGLWRKRESEAMAPLKKEIVDAVKHFDGEIPRVKEEMKALVEEMEARHDHQFVGLRDSLTATVNGYGDRVTRVERNQAAQDELNDRWIAQMSESAKDREHINKRLDEFGRVLEDIRRAVSQR